MFNIHFKLVTMALFWASSYPFGRWIAPYEAPAAAVVVRTLVAFCFLAGIAGATNKLRIRVTPRDAAQFLLLGASGICIHNYLLFQALEFTEAGRGAVINGAIPIMVMALDYVFFKRRVGAWSTFGVMLSFAGTAVVVSHGDMQSLLTGGLGRGEALLLIAIVGWSVYSIAARPLLEKYSAVAVSAYACLVGALLMLPALFREMDSALALAADAHVVVALIVQGFLSIGLGFLWYYEGVKAIGPMNAAIYLNLVPLFGVGLASLTLNEIPDASLMLGGALVVGGLLLVNRVEARRERPAATASASA